MRHLRILLLLGFVLATAGAILTTLPGIALAQDAAAGRELFQSKGCSACHTKGFGDLIGPDLQGVKDRVPDRDWAARFIRDPKAANDEYATRMKAILPAEMTPNPGISDGDLQKILDFLWSSETFGQKRTIIPKDDATIELGRKYFTGEMRFKNGGPACVSCHTIEGVGGFGGGSLASGIGSGFTSLNKAHERNGGDAGLFSVLSNPQFVVMKNAFATKPLAEEEAVAVTAYLGQVSAGATDEPGSVGMIVLLALLSLAGTGLLIFGFDRIWNKRLRNVRKTLVGEQA